MGEGGFRVGIGYDIHRLMHGVPLVLGGVRLEHERGLSAHSDGDTLAHAIGDALLGAMGLGDLGQHFPDSDPGLRGISSMDLLRRIRAMVAERGGSVVNVDATLILESPRIAPYASTMRSNLASALDVDEDRISVKATTNERLGALGREEGIAAMAVALVEVKGR